MSKTDKFQGSSSQLRILTTEFDISDPISKKLLDYSQQQFEVAGERVCRFTGLVDEKHLKVLKRSIGGNDYNFNIGHNMPFSEEISKYPVVIEYFLAPAVLKCLVRVQVALVYYDGLSGLHTSYSILEDLEHSNNGTISPKEYMTKSSFKGSNGPPPKFGIRSCVNLLSHMLKLLYFFIIGLFCKYILHQR